MREATHSHSDGGRSQGGPLSPTDSNDAWRCRGPGGVRGAERPGDVKGLVEHSGVLVTSGRDAARGLKD